ncbi:MAG: ribosome small subunit-dependent GTPase A, partial [Spirochaetota bacterium]
GVREFGMVELDEPEVRSYFYEFGTYAAECAFSDCTHYHEPDCAVKRAVEKGEISDERYVSYCNILLSVIEARENMYR